MTAPVRDGKGALAIVVTGWDAEAWATRFRALAPARGVYIWPDQIGAPPADRLCLRVEAAARHARGVPQSQGGVLAWGRG
jgi:hypothetical protein